MSLMRIVLVLTILGIWSCSSDNNNKANKKITKNAQESSQKVEQTDSVAKDAPKTIVFFGNSLTAAYQLDPSDGFAGLTQKRLDSLSYNYRVVNAGLSGETSAGGLERVDWILEQKVDIFILELGANDALRGLNLDKTYENLSGILRKVKTAHPDATLVIAGMLSPPNMGSDFAEKFAAIYPRLAKEYEAALIPFLLDKVGGVPTLNLADGIHPNKAGHRIVAETVWNTLQTLL